MLACGQMGRTDRCPAHSPCPPSQGPGGEQGGGDQALGPPQDPRGQARGQLRGAALAPAGPPWVSRGARGAVQPEAAVGPLAEPCVLPWVAGSFSAPSRHPRCGPRSRVGLWGPGRSAVASAAPTRQLHSAGSSHCGQRLRTGHSWKPRPVSALGLGDPSFRLRDSWQIQMELPTRGGPARGLLGGTSPPPHQW